VKCNSLSDLPGNIGRRGEAWAWRYRGRAGGACPGIERRGNL